jgi:hypothetical protein
MLNLSNLCAFLQGTRSSAILMFGTYTGEDSWHSNHFVVFKKL